MLTLELIVTKVGAQEIGKSAVAAVAAVGILNAANLHLSVNPVALSENSVPADVTGGANVPTYTGYAAEAVTWLAPASTDDGEIVMMGTAGEFRPTNAAASDLIKSLAVLNTAGTKVLAVANFPAPGVPMASALDNLIATLLWRPQGGGEVDVIS